jgi:hypothetical protein
MEDVLKQAAEYERSYTIVGRVHYIASDKFAARNRWLGIPVVLISTVVGTTIFGTLNEDPDPKIRIAAGLLSLIGAVLAALETTFGYAHTAERHKAAAARYRVIYRKLKTFRLKYSDASSEKRGEAISELEALNKELDAISSESPSIPDACYDRAVRDYDLEHKPVNSRGPG